jgi:uncharacterized tellurite resistance protein B-like protein
MRVWSRLRPLFALAAIVVPVVALARIGGGQHYSSGHSYGSGSSGGGGGGGVPIGLLFDAIIFTFQHPLIMIPFWIVVGIVWWSYQKTYSPTATTQKALEKAEAEFRTRVDRRDIDGWVNALKLKDPGFELAAFEGKVRELFVRAQEAWFLRNLEPVRPFMSDATYQRFVVQLGLLSAQGVRDAIADVEVLEVLPVGLDQSQWFDTLHVRITARMRDVDVPASTSDDAARAAAKRAELEEFIEVWSFVRKPGTRTKIGADLYQGKCPNCGAPFDGGAANNCSFCGAILNSGNYDWTLSEITQGVEAVHGYELVDGLLEAREADPALNLEVLEDRAALVFWKYIQTQSEGQPGKLAKLATGAFLQSVEQELQVLRSSGRRKVFLECAVGAVNTRLLRVEGGRQQAHMEIRWSARMGTGPASGETPRLPTVPQRWMFVLTRAPGAKTNVANGVSTNRCPNCNAPLTDSLSPSCDFCGAMLANGDGDWVLLSADPFEAWTSHEDRRYAQVAAAEAARRTPKFAYGTGDDGSGTRLPDAVMDVRERERLLYMMAAMAAADGVVDDKERKLLKLCSERWNVAWSNVELALDSGEQLFDRLVPKGSPEAEKFLSAIVQMALVDGRIDRKERRMLEYAAQNLGIPERLEPMLQQGRG